MAETAAPRASVFNKRLRLQALNPFRTKSADVPTRSRARARVAGIDTVHSQPPPRANLNQGTPQGEGSTKVEKPERSRSVDVQGDLLASTALYAVAATLKRSSTDPDMLEYMKYKKRKAKGNSGLYKNETIKAINKPRRLNQTAEMILFARKVAATIFIIWSSLWFFEATTNPKNRHLFQSLEDFYVEWIRSWFDIGKAFQDTLDSYSGIMEEVQDFLYFVYSEMTYTETIEVNETVFLNT